MMELIKQIWYGKISLPKLFWFGWVLPSYITNTVFPEAFWEPFLAQNPVLGWFSASIMLGYFYGFIGPSLWRTTHNYTGAIGWVYITRFILIVAYFYIVFLMGKGFSEGSIVLQ